MKLIANRKQMHEHNQIKCQNVLKKVFILQKECKQQHKKNDCLFALFSLRLRTNKERKNDFANWAHIKQILQQSSLVCTLHRTKLVLPAQINT